MDAGLCGFWFKILFMVFVNRSLITNENRGYAFACLILAG
ncbi:hypothetical protein HMPREF1139_1591 [Campylobacter sp. FOBRC14]|nr:hypothetical protein HMPREF1139_1591 [Campylobacter sp. FOBRC14]